MILSSLRGKSFTSTFITPLNYASIPHCSLSVQHVILSAGNEVHITGDWRRLAGGRECSPWPRPPLAAPPGPRLARPSRPLRRTATTRSELGTLGKILNFNLLSSLLLSASLHSSFSHYTAWRDSELSIVCTKNTAFSQQRTRSRYFHQRFCLVCRVQSVGQRNYTSFFGILCYAHLLEWKLLFFGATLGAESH